MLHGWETWAQYNAIISHRYPYGFIYKLFCTIRGGGKKVVKNDVVCTWYLRDVITER